MLNAIDGLNDMIQEGFFGFKKSGIDFEIERVLQGYLLDNPSWG